MGVFYFCLVVASIIAWVFAAKEFQHIAEMKGYDGSKYFWWTLFFTFAGMLMVIALPTKTGTPSTGTPNTGTPNTGTPNTARTDELPEI